MFFQVDSHLHTGGLETHCPQLHLREARAALVMSLTLGGVPWHSATSFFLACLVSWPSCALCICTLLSLSAQRIYALAWGGVNVLFVNLTISLATRSVSTIIIVLPAGSCWLEAENWQVVLAIRSWTLFQYSKCSFVVTLPGHLFKCNDSVLVNKHEWVLLPGMWTQGGQLHMHICLESRIFSTGALVVSTHHSCLLCEDFLWCGGKSPFSINWTKWMVIRLLSGKWI